MKSLYRKVESFDGQTITIDGKPSYELGSFLGGGAAGVVYEGTDVSETSQFRPVAIKILNPVGFRLAPAATLRRCVVARRGQLVAGVSASSSGSGGCSSSSSSASTSSCPAAPTAGGAGAGTGATPAAAASGFPSTGAGVGVPPGGVKPHKLGPEHVWWLVSPNTKQVLAAYMDPRYGSLVELPLPKCIEIWGLNPGMGARAPPPSAASSPSAATTPATAAAAASAAAAAAANAAYSAQDSWGDGSSAGSSTTGSTATTTTTTTERGFDAEGEADLFGDGGGYPADGRRGAFEVKVDGMGVSIPWLPPKYVQWLSQRRKVKREINNMGRVGGHRNVLELLSVLELLQDSKSTLFLILELVTGGELLDHIRLAGEEGRRATGFRTRTASALRAEGAAQRYFSQLLSGLAYCHRRGVCHRDLSPSNLLLAESPQGDTPPVLKVADFGLSACCAGGFSATGNENQDARTKERRGFPHRVRSVVGSPYYMAPEVTTGSTKGYDGFKADAWSCGVVLYTMLTQSLPFERDLSRCPRYKRFKSWADKHGTGSSSSSSRKSRTVPRTIPRFCSPSSASPSTSPLTTTLPSDSAAVNNTPAIPSPLLQPPASSTLQGAPQGRIGPPSPVASAPVPPPAWLFPPTIPPGAKSLLVSLLAPHPSRRMSVEQALLHPWLVSASRGDAAATAAAAAASSGVLQGGSVPVSSLAPTISTTTAADSAGATLLVEGNGPHGGVGGGAADSTRDFVGERGHAHQQQHQRCVGSGAFFTVPGGGRGSVVNNPNIGGGGDSQIPGGNGGTADSSANEKVSREGGGWGSSTANLPREFGCSAIPSTTSFP